MASNPLPTVEVIESPVTALPLEEQIQVMVDWAKTRASKFVCVANTHMLVEAHSSLQFNSVLHLADMVTPDGMPLVWIMKLLGVYHQNRVAGMDIFERLCEEAAQHDLGIFFVGSQPQVLDKIKARLTEDYPNLRVAGMESLPFRPMTRDENNAILQTIEATGASLVFVSLGCPKQELWMAQHRGIFPGVMIGLGGVFPVYAGIQKRAPQWVRDAGLEWLYRLGQEPRRLWKRYGSTIPVFIVLAIRQLMQQDVRVMMRSRPLNQ